MIFLQIRVRRNRARDASCHPMIYPIQRRTQGDTIIIHPALLIIIKIQEIVSIFLSFLMGHTNSSVFVKRSKCPKLWFSNSWLNFLCNGTWSSKNMIDFWLSCHVPAKGVHNIQIPIIIFWNIAFAVTPNSTLDANITTNNNGSSNINASNVTSADSSVASSISLDDEDESPAKVKKEDNHVNIVYKLEI